MKSINYFFLLILIFTLFACNKDIDRNGFNNDSFDKDDSLYLVSYHLFDSLPISLKENINDFSDYIMMKNFRSWKSDPSDIKNVFQVFLSANYLDIGNEKCKIMDDFNRGYLIIYPTQFYYKRHFNKNVKYLGYVRLKLFTIIFYSVCQQNFISESLLVNTFPKMLPDENSEVAKQTINSDFEYLYFGINNEGKLKKICSALNK